jgi:hypothetical protein
MGVEIARCLVRPLGLNFRAVAAAVLGTLCLTLGIASPSGAQPVYVPPTSIPPPPPGYWLLGSDGGVFSFNAPFFGSATSWCATSEASHLENICAAGIASTPDGGGYTVLGFFGEGSPVPIAPQFGDATGSGACAIHFNASGGPQSPQSAVLPPWVGLASTPSGHGFWLVGPFGNIATCGDASYFGAPGDFSSANGFVTISEAIGIVATPDGKGYWVAASDGGVFAYGDAGFYGSMGGKSLNAPIVGIARTPDGKGYWLVASDGGIFSFGDAAFSGSMGGKQLNAPMVGIAADPYGGYWTVASDGGVFSFGGAPFEGSMGGQSLAGPIVGITSRV